MNKLISFLPLSLIGVGCIAGSVPSNQPSPFQNLQFQQTYTNGLSNEDRSNLYQQDEGIRWLETNVLVSLDRSKEDGIGLYDEPFFKNPERFGLYKNPLNPNGLPIGITHSNDAGLLPTSGLNCSACHSSVISSNGKSVVVDGNGGLFAIDKMVKEMIFSLALTASSPIEFYKFYERYKANSITPKLSAENDEQLKSVFGSEEYKIAQTHLTNLKIHSKEHEQGLASFKSHLQAQDSALSDAYPAPEDLDSAFKVFGYMVRRIAFFYGKVKYTSTPAGTVSVPSVLGSSNPWAVVQKELAVNLLNIESDNFAPVQGGNVRTPHIFSYERQHWIFLSNCTDDLLGRHIAQAQSLLTDFDWTTKATTANIKNIEKISVLTRKITPPIWDESVFGALDMNKVQAGKAIAKKYCLTCHDPMLDKQDRASAYYNVYDTGTDFTYIKAQQAAYYGKNFFDVLQGFIKEVKTKEAKNEGISSLAPYEINRTDENWHSPAANTFSAKPLFGLWASGPFLHNGSVSSIFQLLLPETQRAKSVIIGNIELDTKDLGFVQKEVWYGSTLDTSLVGNSNLGHSGEMFGTNLSIDEKYQLIEFLKSYNIDTRFE